MIPELRVTLQGAASGRIQWHVIPEPHITLQSAATWWIQSHDSRATCHIAGCSHLAKSMSWSCHITGCKNSIRHIEHCFSPYFFVFNAVWVLTSSGFCIVSDTLTLVIVIVQFHVLGQHGSDWSGDLATSTLTYRSEELTAGGDAVSDTDSRWLFHFHHHCGIRDLGDLLSFLIQSPTGFHDTRRNDWRWQGTESKHSGSDPADIRIRIQINQEIRIQISRLRLDSLVKVCALWEQSN